MRLRAAKGGLSAADRKLLGDEAAKLGLERGRPAPRDAAHSQAGRGRRALTATPSSTTTRPPTCSTHRPAGRFGWRSSIWAAATCTTRSACRATPQSTYIAARADEERQRWMKKAQVTAEKTAWLEIITHAQSHLSSPKARARYDRTLAQEAEESFEGLAAFALKGVEPARPGHATRP